MFSSVSVENNVGTLKKLDYVEKGAEQSNTLQKYSF